MVRRGVRKGLPPLPVGLRAYEGSNGEDGVPGLPRGAHPSGPSAQSGLGDDTVRLGRSLEDVSAITKALPAAEDAVALGSDVSKMHGLRTWMEGQRVRYGVPLVVMNGVRLPVPSEAEYVRSLGRHALPHTYHKEDFRKFMMAARRASAVIPIKSLRAQYPPAMYNPKAGGIARFQAGVRPPPSLSGYGTTRTTPPSLPSGRLWAKTC